MLNVSVTIGNNNPSYGALNLNSASSQAFANARGLSCSDETSITNNALDSSIDIIKKPNKVIDN